MFQKLTKQKCHMKSYPTSSPDSLVEAYLELSTRNVSDALDGLKLNGTPHGILPLWPGCRKIVGKAMTMKLISQGDNNPVLGTLETILDAQRGSVFVIDQRGRMDANSCGHSDFYCCPEWPRGYSGRRRYT